MERICFSETDMCDLDQPPTSDFGSPPTSPTRQLSTIAVGAHQGECDPRSSHLWELPFCNRTFADRNARRTLTIAAAAIEPDPENEKRFACGSGVTSLGFVSL
jgi:hypothetical protein